MTFDQQQLINHAIAKLNLLRIALRHVKLNLLADDIGQVIDILNKVIERELHGR